MNRKFFIGIFLFAMIILFSNISSAYMSSNPQTSQFGMANFQIFDKSVCQKGQDFLVQVAPFGCTPAVIRSDLLEENDVPVYCKLGATKINPLIDVQAIDSISFSGQYPKEISAIGFHPAKSALGIQGDLNTPVLNNIGYVVINLKKQPNESAMPDYVSGNLTAKIKYNIKNAFGIGNALFYLPQLSSEDWQSKKYQYSFWNGRGYIKADDVTNNGADISVYSENNKLAGVHLEKGQSSDSIYLPGFECEAGLKLKLEDLINPDTRAKLRINAEVADVAKGEKFLNNKCSVSDLNTNGIMQQVSIKCQEDTGATTSTLTLSPKIILNINGENKEFSLGDRLYEGAGNPQTSTLGLGSYGIYLGYAGTTGDSRKSEDLFVFLVALPLPHADKLTDDELASWRFFFQNLILAKIPSSGLIEQTAAVLKNFAGGALALEKFIAEGKQFWYLKTGDSANIFEMGNQVSIAGFAGAQDFELTGNVKDNYDKAKENYDEIINGFSSQPYVNGETTFGEEALYKKIQLADYANQKLAASDLCKEFEQTYPDSSKNLADYCSDYKFANSEIANAFVTINKENLEISFDGIYEPTFNDYGARIMANTPKGAQYFDLSKNEKAYISAEGNDYIQLLSLDDDSARVQLSVTTDKGTKSGAVDLQKNIENNFEIGYSFTLSEIHLNKLAKVSVLSNINNAGTEANFSFKIGIEKRALNLSPEKIKQNIENVNIQISTWQNISNALGNVTQGLKTGCFATGVALVAENLLLNAGGTGIARQFIMRGTGGWSEKCSSLVSKGTYNTQDECFSKNADQIDNDVGALSKIVDSQNSKIKQLEEGITTQDLIAGTVVNTSAFMERYTLQVDNLLNSNLPDSITDPLGKGEAIDKNSMLDVLSYNNWKANQFSEEQLRNIELNSKILNDASASPELKEIANQRLYSDLLNVKTNSEVFIQRQSFLQKYGFDEGYIGTNQKLQEISLSKLKTFSEVSGFSGADISPEDYVYPYKDSLTGKEYLITLDNDYVVKQTYSINNGALSISSEQSINPLSLSFKKYDFSSYANQYKNPQLSYYETEPYKGLPAIIPFDLANGWYAATKPTLPTGGNIQPYDASARVNSFYLCNVGANGIEEFSGVGDDTCEMINLGTGQPYNQFPGLNENEARSIVDKARNAIEQTSKVSESQRKGFVSIAGQRVKVGEPAVGIPQFQCQDFMSPKECLLLFNLCDPVICPSSRCDLGGTYPVRDVVQSGIIGSIALCFPNIKEGIIFPVCLTGVKAGIDGLLSVITSYRDCMQESLDTGKTVGICDEVYSIYLCDFLWRQALPLADIAIPKIVELLLGQNVRGGGEYLGITSAWDNAQSAINYFVNSYGVNSKAAFSARTTEVLQGETCKLFTSAVVPSGAELLDTLTQPDSPVQFTGRFDEIPLTTATNPPTSHYKVFYHIFAGKDSGAYYQVYLKGASISSYYQDTSSNIMIASGYIAVGDYASETIDKIATSGYKELCINVNGQEECGFKEVSTDFALNYVKDQYLSSQAGETDIKTESECISGSASAYNLLNPNIQSGAESLFNPAIYNQGIIRICATDNPGKGTDPYAETENSRWIKVGYCGSQDVKCWIDTQSIEDVIKTTTIENATLDSLTANSIDILKNQGGYLSNEQFSSAIREIEDEKDSAKKIALIENIFDKIFLNEEKVQISYLRGNAYYELFKIIWDALPKSEKEMTIQTTPEKTKEEILKINDAGQRVIATASLLQGTIVPAEIPGYKYKMNDNCWTAAIYSYIFSDVNQGRCIYADLAGKKYTFNNPNTNGKDATVTIGITQRGGILIAGTANQGVCNFDSSKINSQEKLDRIQPGYILSILWDGQWAHNVVFLKWIDKDKRIAELFDWNAPVISLGSKDKNGKECDLYSSLPNLQYCKIYRIYTADLNDNANPVFMYWPPYVPFIPLLKQIPVSPSNQEFAPPSVTDSAPQETGEISMGDKIWQAAGILVPASNSQQTNNENALSFVYDSLTHAGVKNIGSRPNSLESFISILDNNQDFSEIDISDNYNNLKRGDIILIGQACNKPYSIAILSSSGFSDTSISFFTNLKGKVDIEDIPYFIRIHNGIYTYKAYRYTGDLSETEKTSIKAREKWTLDNAITKVSTLKGSYSDDIYINGVYSENNAFVNQLIFDGILTEKDCNDIRGATEFLQLFNPPKDMNWLKKLLLSKKASQVS